MTRKPEWLSARELKDITTDIASLFSDTEASVAVTYRVTGTISFDLTGSISETNATTILIPAIIGGYGQQARGGYAERDRSKGGSLMPDTELYFLVRDAAVSSPETIDRIAWDGNNYMVTAIKRDTLGTHYRIEVKRS